jgi:hypothetical protein
MKKMQIVKQSNSQSILVLHAYVGIENILSQEPVAHTYNPSYSGGRDQEDRSSKPVWANSSQDPISKKTHHKEKGLME